jgi:hypothetical protein
MYEQFMFVAFATDDLARHQPSYESHRHIVSNLKFGGVDRPTGLKLPEYQSNRDILHD